MLLSWKATSFKEPFIFLFETKSQKIAQAGLELMIFLAQPPECWDYRCASPYQI
jgi:hypothetical protein